MLQSGIVKGTGSGGAKVEITRSTACGESCASCGLCPGQTTVVTAENTLSAKEGDRVVIDMADKKVLGAAFLVYILPVAALIAGYFAGYAFTGSETASSLIGFLCMAVFFAVIITLDKRLKKRYTPKIIRIEDNNND